MYLFYIDESGNRDPNFTDDRYVYVLTAVGLFSDRWKSFFEHLTRFKRKLARDVSARTGISLESFPLEACEIKSNWIRQPKEREKRVFLAHLTAAELTELSDIYFRQLEHHNMVVISVVIDKRKLHDYMDGSKLHRKAWELLAERIENFMSENHPKHKAMMITDDMSIQENHSLAVKHAHLMLNQTTAGVNFRQLIEMPHFVRSEFSEGVQLADMCAYSIYRAMNTNDPSYPYFERVKRHFYSSKRTHADKTDGLKIFPDNSELKKVFR